MSEVQPHNKSATSCFLFINHIDMSVTATEYMLTATMIAVWWRSSSTVSCFTCCLLTYSTFHANSWSKLFSHGFGHLMKHQKTFNKLYTTMTALVSTYLNTYTNTYIHTYIHACIHTITYIHTYIYTYIHTHTHTHIYTGIHVRTYLRSFPGPLGELYAGVPYGTILTQRPLVLWQWHLIPYKKCTEEYTMMWIQCNTM